MSSFAHIWTPNGPGLQAAMDVQIYTTDGFWTNPSPTSRRLGFYRLVGGGGGSGSGRRGAVDTVRCGGGGGAGGSVHEGWFFTDLLFDGQYVTVGSGGLPGNSPEAANTNGANGTVGGTTSFGELSARGGNPGMGGTTSSGVAGAATANSCLIGGAAASNLPGGAASTTGGVAGVPVNSNLILPSGGGAGAGITSGNVYNWPGRGGAIASASATAAGLAANYWSAAAYSAGDYAGLVGMNPTPPYPIFRNPWGVGLGGGGGKDSRSVCQRGGFPGGGGGGADARENGAEVIANDGYGGDGIAIIIVY